MTLATPSQRPSNELKHVSSKPQPTIADLAPEAGRTTADPVNDASAIYVDPAAEKKLSNLGNAFSTSLPADLALPANGQSLLTSIFFVTYVLFETPSAVIFKRFGARLIISLITIGWGLCTLFTGFFPILSVYLSDWFKREELGRRTSFLFVAAAVSDAFGGLLAFGIFHMDGVAGLEAWRWLYVLEGTIKVVAGTAVWFMLADDFEKAWFLDEGDREVMRLRRRQSAAYDGEGKFSWSEAGAALRDAKFCADTCLFAYAVFLPSIIRTFNASYSTVEVQLLTVPCYSFTAVSYILAASLMDRIRYRGVTLVGAALIMAVCFGLLLAVKNTGARYFACFLVALVYTMVGLNVSWLNCNNAPSLKRATAAGM
ncbi:hypothetical protein ACQY0O_003830 [Thecaphora frezii]